MKTKSACTYLVATTDVTSSAVFGPTKNFTATLKHLSPLLKSPNTINLKQLCSIQKHISCAASGRRHIGGNYPLRQVGPAPRTSERNLLCLKLPPLPLA
jgi:hypothetical protein